MRPRTDRLLLRPLEEADLDAFVAHRRDPVVARLRSRDTGFALQDARRLLREQDGRPGGRPRGWIQLALLRRADGVLLEEWTTVGVCALPGVEWCGWPG